MIRIIIRVMMKNGIPMAKNNVLLTAPNIKAVNCSKIIVIPTSKSAVILVSIFSIFLSMLSAFLRLDPVKIFSILDLWIKAPIFSTIFCAENLKYRLRRNIFIKFAKTNVRAVIP
jgi:hypothetical protein